MSDAHDTPTADTADDPVDGMNAHELADAGAAGTMEAPAVEGSVIEQILELVKREIVDMDVVDAEKVDHILPREITTRLNATLPRDAFIHGERSFEALNPNTGVIDTITEPYSYVPAPVVDYLGMTIFKDRVSTRILEHARLFADKSHEIDPATRKEATYFLVIYSALVEVKITGKDGQSQVHQAPGISFGKVHLGSDPTPAFRMAMKGAITDARRTALQLFGPVFGGIDTRDKGGIIAQVRARQQNQRRKQKAPSSAREGVEIDQAELDSLLASKRSGPQESDDAKPAKAARVASVKPGLRDALSPAGRVAEQGGSITIAPAKPAAKSKPDAKAKPAEEATSAPKAAKPKVERLKPTDSGRFAMIAADGKTIGSTNDPDVLVAKILQLFGEAKTAEALDLVMEANNAAIEELIGDDATEVHAGRILSGHEDRHQALEAAAARASRKAEKASSDAGKSGDKTAKATSKPAKGGKAKKSQKDKSKAKIAHASGEADKAGEETDSKTGETKPAAAPVSEADKPAAQALPASLATSLGGFDADPAPSVAGTAPQLAPVSEGDWTLPAITLEFDANGAPIELFRFGTELTTAVMTAPSPAMLDRIIERYSDDLERLPDVTRRFIAAKIDNRRADLTKKVA